LVFPACRRFVWVPKAPGKEPLPSFLTKVVPKLDAVRRGGNLVLVAWEAFKVERVSIAGGKVVNKRLVHWIEAWKNEAPDA
jgi:hypothetical protein